MALIQCTKKLLQHLPRNKQSNTQQTTATILGNWHANILRLNRRNHILFTNDITLYSLVVPNVIKKDFDNLETVFTQHLRSWLLEEGLQDFLEILMQEYKTISFVPSANRRIVGSMLDISRVVFIYWDCDPNSMTWLNQRLNDNILKLISYRSPRESLYQLLEKHEITVPQKSNVKKIREEALDMDTLDTSDECTICEKLGIAHIIEKLREEDLAADLKKALKKKPGKRNLSEPKIKTKGFKFIRDEANE